MDRFKYVILGAGPTGLAFARGLQVMGEDSFVVLEKESEAGGLCRSRKTGYGVADVGGGHMWHTKHLPAEVFVKRHLPDSEWLTYDRRSTVMFRGHELDYPIEEHLWQLPGEMAEDMVLDILSSRLEKSSPRNFKEFVQDKFGTILADSYMLPYNSKLWGEPLERISLSWLHKIPSVDARQVIRSVMARSGDRKALFHHTWQYPRKGGFQAVTDSLAAPLSGHISYGEPLSSLEILGSGGMVNGRYAGECVVNTLPWPVVAGACNAPFWTRRRMRRMEAVPLNVGLVLPESRGEPCPQWTYYPDMDVSYHRKFFTSTWMPGAGFDFTETNANRHGPPCLVEFYNEYAYPVYTRSRDADMAAISRWAYSRNILPIGRWGRWDYANSDVCIMQSLEEIGKIFGRDPMDIANMA